MKYLILLFLLISSIFAQGYIGYTGYGTYMAQQNNKCSKYMGIDSNVKGNWIFDSDYHTNILSDVSSYGNTLLAGANFDYTAQDTADAPFCSGKALYFDGTDDYFYIPSADASDFDPGSGDFTVEAWINIPEFTTTYKTIYAKFYHTTNDNGIWITTYGDGVRITIYNGSSGYTRITTPSFLTANTWYYLAFVLSGTDLRVYSNGVSIASTTYSTGAIPTEAADVHIGQRNSDLYFKGKMAEVRYSNKAKTASELLDYYNSTQ